MDHESPPKRVLRKAGDVTGAGASLKPVDKDDLAANRELGLVFQGDNRRAIVDLVLLPSRRKAPLVDLARPEVARDRQQMGIFDDGLKIRMQIRL